MWVCDTHDDTLLTSQYDQGDCDRSLGCQSEQHCSVIVPTLNREITLLCKILFIWPMLFWGQLAMERIIARASSFGHCVYENGGIHT